MRRYKSTSNLWVKSRRYKIQDNLRDKIEKIFIYQIPGNLWVKLRRYMIKDNLRVTLKKI